MPKIIEAPDLIRCEYAHSKGWPHTFRRGAKLCTHCDQLDCTFQASPSSQDHQNTINRKAASQSTQVSTQGFSSQQNIKKLPKQLTIHDLLNTFPSQTMRLYQKDILREAIEAFQTGKKCIILAAPTGFGKSYVNTAFSSLIDSFYTTPQLVLINQILKDPLLQSRFVEIKGRQNYQCYHHPTRTVNMGKCITDDYACKERYDVCPYWIQKKKALNAQSVLSSFSYLIAEGQAEVTSNTYLGKRSLLILDEAHNIEDICLNHISIRVSPFTIPYTIYQKLLPQLLTIKSDRHLLEFLQNLEEQLNQILRQAKTITKITGLSIDQVEDLEKIDRYLAKYNLYKNSHCEWVWQIKNNNLILQPVFSQAFMDQMIWKRADHYIISSATILNPLEYAKLTGLLDILAIDEISYLKVPSTFQPQNRPIIDATVGPLSRQGWDENKYRALQTIEDILKKETWNVAIHCHSYQHQQYIATNISDDLKSRLIIHTKKNREQKLDEWMSSRGKVFVSVAFNEGQDWKYDICDAQILLKVPFPDLGDKRVRRRLDLGNRQWYENQTLTDVMQAYGRAIRAEDDQARFYIIDGSFNPLVKKWWYQLPDWFREVLPQSLLSHYGKYS